VTLNVAVGELKDEEVVATAPEKGELGLTVQRLTPQMAESLGLERAEGIVVTAVEPAAWRTTPAYGAATSFWRSIVSRYEMSKNIERP